MQQRFAQCAGERSFARPRHQVQNDFGIAGRLKDGSFALQIAPQLRRVGDVAVVRHRDLSLVARHQERLRVEQYGIAGGGITRVADRHVAGQACDLLRRENIGDMPHGFGTADLAMVAGGDARALLAAMLQRVEPEVRQVGSFGMAVNGEDAALLAKLVEGFEFLSLLVQQAFE